MRKLAFTILTVIMLLAACAKPSENITFTAVVESVYDNGITVKTSDSAVDFDIARVGFDESCEISFDIAAGQTVEVTILPGVRESYPVQVTAVKIKLTEDIENMGYKKTSGDKAAEMMNGDVIILDVRTIEEYNDGHIKNAVLLPYDEIGALAEETLPDKQALILVYCRTGRRSEIAAKDLVSMGYTAVFDFGGIETDWNGEVVN